MSALNFCTHPASRRKKSNCDSLSQWFPLAAASRMEGYGFPEPGKASVSACRSSLVLLPGQCAGWIKHVCLQRPSSQLLPRRRDRGISLSPVCPVFWLSALEEGDWSTEGWEQAPSRQTALQHLSAFTICFLL